MGDTLAVDGGAPVRRGEWPRWPVWDATEERALLEVLHSGQWWSVGGTKVPEFEAAFAAMQGARFACAVTNGSAALEIMLRAMGIGCGDEVIVPAYTFIATASSAVAVGARPVFVDIERASLNLDPAKIEAAITPRTRAVIPVHVGGAPADMDGILEVARRHGLAVIEDAAQAPLASWRGRPVGTLGDVGSFSFQASKNLNSGEGGVVVTDDPELAEKVWSVHNVGRRRGGAWYEHEVLGGNHRMTEWQAAILLAQMTRLEAQAATRAANAATLHARLAPIPGVTPPVPDPRITRHAWHLYSLRIDPEAFGNRPLGEVVAALNAEGIPADQGYAPLYREDLFRKPGRGLCQRCAWSYGDVACPETEEAARTIVRLHQNVLLADERAMDEIAAAVAKVQRAWGG